MKGKEIYYSVGALLYCPANNKAIASKVINEVFGKKYSLAFCLEDTIRDNAVAEAEGILVHTLREIYGEAQHRDFYVPKIFIRVRRPDQIPDLLDRLGSAREIITGFNPPKFDNSNADEYISVMKSAVEKYSRKYYMMPILESHEMVNLQTRYDFLYGLKEKIDCVNELVLNVRVGGNDLSHLFGLRRHSFETVYDIRPVADILTDILTVFSQDYVVSGAVWEYYNGEKWDSGMRKEIQKDLTAGFCGKTVIHPKQIDVLNDACRVLKEDLADAENILSWSSDTPNMVNGSQTASRMNEYKVHTNWARKIKFMAEYYGVK